jgi:hypothetical protein
VLGSADVIEIEYEQISFPAINARMSLQVFQHQAAIPICVDSVQSVPTCIVSAFRSTVVLSHIRQLTRLAIRSRVTAFLFEERVERFFLSTTWANFHTNIVVFSCAIMLA